MPFLCQRRSRSARCGYAEREGTSRRLGSWRILAGILVVEPRIVRSRCDRRAAHAFADPRHSHGDGLDHETGAAKRPARIARGHFTEHAQGCNGSEHSASIKKVTAMTQMDDCNSSRAFRFTCFLLGLALPLAGLAIW